MKTVAVIPIKTNNQRLPGKNTKMLGRVPLYEWGFDVARGCSVVDRVYVCSSDTIILSAAHSFGLGVINRPVELNSAETSGHDLIVHELNSLDLDDDDIFVQLFVTQPFLQSSTIDSAVQLLREDKNKTSVLALFEMENRFWYDGDPISHDPKILRGTQYEKPVYCEAGFYVFKVGAFKSEGCRVTKDRIEYVVNRNECVDIDTELDFKYAKAIVESC